ncbi:GIY-YIG nuclease family protein [Microtetraspora malaysiensis]|uniref:GIY-YIG nuclease family protein n=1 Tax=Microtetraspora malaysiensis TaxID=161358 RepID=A0ABW6SMB2_9ACTN
MPENAQKPNDEGLAPYEDTLFHIELIRNKIDKLITVQVNAEQQLLHRAGRDYTAGRLPIESLSVLYQRYRDTVWRQEGGRRFYFDRAPFTWVWNINVPIRSDELPHLLRRLERARRNAPNDANGSWSGEYPLDDEAPRPLNGESVVYLLFDTDNVPCYVGSTEYFKSRIQAHGRDKKFVRWAAYPCADREAAYLLEERLLKEHKPYLNRKVTR